MDFFDTLQKLNKSSGMISDNHIFDLLNTQFGGYTDTNDVISYYDKQNKYINNLFGNINKSNMNYEFFDDKVRIYRMNKLLLTSTYSYLIY